MSMKINRLEIENVKRIKAVKLEPAQNGLTIIGGDNQQGKTSVLDSIAWALGGERYKPSQSTREGSMVPPNLPLTGRNLCVSGISATSTESPVLRTLVTEMVMFM